MPLRGLLFPSSEVDKSTDIPPLATKKRTLDGKSIRERRSTNNVPYTAHERVKAWVPADPTQVDPDDINLARLDNAQLQKFADEIAAIDVKQVGRDRLVMLAVKAGLHKSGNKANILARLKEHYACVKKTVV